MNKKLVALAVAGVLGAPLAQAQTANVTLYGRVNLDVEFVNGKIYNNNVTQPATCNKTLNQGGCITTNPTAFRESTNSSRFGLRGTESLGGGLNAIFQVESSVNPAQSGGTLAGRESYVGLQGGWGTFKLGRFLTPYDDIHPIFGNVPTLTTSILSTASLWAQGFLSTATGGFDDRVAASVRYDSPNLSGFNFELQYGQQGTNYADPGATIKTPTVNNARIMSAAAFYNNGPVTLGIAYTGSNGVRGRQTIATPPATAPAGTSNTGGTLKDYAFSVAGAYSFSVVRVGAVYEMLKYDNGGLAGGDLKRNMWGVSLTGNLGPGQLYGYYGQANNVTGSAPDYARVGGMVKGPDSRATQYEVSYTYPFSKRTLTYVGYNRINNRNNAAYNFNINPYNPTAADSSYNTPGGKPGGLVFGLVHFF
ncbi:MAG: porin [Casimicrobiaceae bacterium]